MEVIRTIADRVAVIDAGQIVEEGPVWSVFANPRTATTQSLLAGIRPGLPPTIAARLVPGSGGPDAGETILGVDLSGPEAGTLLSGLSTDVSGRLRLIHGGIDAIQGQPVARFFVGVPSSAGAQAIAFLERRGAKVEVFGHVADHA